MNTAQDEKFIGEHFDNLVCLHIAFDPSCANHPTYLQSFLETGMARVACEMHLHFNQNGFKAIILNVRGKITDGIVNISTPSPEKILPSLLPLFRSFLIRDGSAFMDGGTLDLSNFIHMAWWDAQDRIIRTYFPKTTRPFWTYLEAPEKVGLLLSAGMQERKRHEAMNASKKNE